MGPGQVEEKRTVQNGKLGNLGLARHGRCGHHLTGLAAVVCPVWGTRSCPALRYPAVSRAGSAQLERATQLAVRLLGSASAAAGETVSTEAGHGE